MGDNGTIPTGLPSPPSVPHSPSSGTTSISNAPVVSLPAIKTIWDDDMIEVKLIGTKIVWFCHWCNHSFNGKNATKAICHLCKITKQDIRVCTAKIDDAHSQRYQKLRDRTNSKRKAIEIANKITNESIDNGQAMLLKKRSKSSEASISSVSSISAATAISVAQRRRPPVIEIDSSTTRTMVQTTLDGRDESCALHVAIADFIHSHGLSFNISRAPKFIKCLRLAKRVPDRYMPPNRREIGGEYLELNHEGVMESELQTLKTDAKIFGLAMFGDGATIAKQPLFNILASGAYSAATCLQIVDCTKQMAKAGGKKDAEYLAKLFSPHIKKIGSENVDLVIFDGASNVQKAGDVIGAEFERISCIHGIEHICSLFFSDCFKIPLVRLLIKFYKVVYGFFGSGSRHAPYAIFMSLARKANKNRKIGLIRAADTRMGGHFIALLRLLRLKGPMSECIVGDAFLQLKLKGAAETVCKVLKRDCFWEMIVTVLRPIVPILRLLRLADSKAYAMDKVVYCVGRTDELLADKAPLLDSLQTDLKFKDIITWMTALVSNESDSQVLQWMSSDVYCDDDEFDDESSLSSQVSTRWQARRSTILNSYAIASWMMSPVMSIMEDAKDRHTGNDRTAVEELLIKLLLPYDRFKGSDDAFEDEKAVMIDKFWDEYNDFTTKTGKFDNRAHMWRSVDLQTDRTHIWHKKNTLPNTKYLGAFACLVSSKPLGIGSAERCWGEVKSLKSGQRTTLGNDKADMLTTIQGRHRAQEARSLQAAKRSLGLDEYEYEGEYQPWDDNDMETLGLTRYGLDLDVITGKKKDARNFRCWVEDWEVELFEKKDPVSKQKFLKKYGGLSFLNVDKPDEGVYTVGVDDLIWRARGGDKGWWLKALNESYDEITNPDKMDEWPIKPNVEGEDQSEIMYCIVEYYKSNPDPYVKLIEKEN